jgi:hypothetical protein
VTWGKYGDELPDDAADLSDAAFRTYVEFCAWSNRRGYDLTIPKRDLRRFAFSDNAEAAMVELITVGWITDNGETWTLNYHPEWQQERVVVEAKREAAALRQQRHRLHVAGDHHLCLHPSVTCDTTSDVASDTTGDPVRDGSVRDGEPEDLATKRSAGQTNVHGIGSCVTCDVFEKLGDDGTCSQCAVAAMANAGRGDDAS